MKIKETLILVAKVIAILARDACAAIVPFAVRNKIGLIKLAKGAGLFAAGLCCGVILRDKFTATHVPAATPFVAANTPAATTPPVASTTTFTASSEPEGLIQPSSGLSRNNKKMPRAAWLNGAEGKPALYMTLIEFRRRLEAIQKGDGRNPPKPGVATIVPLPHGADLIKAFGQPDRMWTATEQEVVHSILENGPIPVTGGGLVENTYTYLAWRCKEGTIALKIDDDPELRDLSVREINVRDIVDDPAPLE